MSFQWKHQTWELVLRIQQDFLEFLSQKKKWLFQEGQTTECKLKSSVFTGMWQVFQPHPKNCLPQNHREQKISPFYQNFLGSGSWFHNFQIFENYLGIYLKIWINLSTFLYGTVFKWTDILTTQLCIHRTPDGTIYLDEKGSVLTKWEPENGVIEVENVLGFKVMWKREKDIIDHAPTAD